MTLRAGPVGRAPGGVDDHRVLGGQRGDQDEQEQGGPEHCITPLAGGRCEITVGTVHLRGQEVQSPDDQSAMRASSVARSLSPDLFIVLRTGLLSRLEAAE